MGMLRCVASVAAWAYARSRETRFLLGCGRLLRVQGCSLLEDERWQRRTSPGCPTQRGPRRHQLVSGARGPLDRVSPGSYPTSSVTPVHAHEQAEHVPEEDHDAAADGERSGRRLFQTHPMHD